jgi:hypothetical protein
MKKELFKIVSASLVVTMLALTGFASVEPVLAQAVTDNVTVTLNVDDGITITDSANTTMSRSLGVTTATAIATSSWNVKTNSVDGYILTVKSNTTNPAMVHSNGTDNVANYTEASAGTPETWSVGASTAEFGYSAYGTDVSTGTWGTGQATTQCGATSTPSTTLKYSPLKTSSPLTVATRSSTTTPTGIDTVVCYAVEQGSSFYVASGVYTATVVATATVQ